MKLNWLTVSVSVSVSSVENVGMWDVAGMWQACGMWGFMGLRRDTTTDDTIIQAGQQQV